MVPSIAPLWPRPTMAPIGPHQSTTCLPGRIAGWVHCDSSRGLGWIGLGHSLVQMEVIQYCSYHPWHSITQRSSPTARDIPPPALKSPPFCRAGSPPKGGGGRSQSDGSPPGGLRGTAPQICTIVPQGKSASAPSAPCKNFLWRLRRLVFSSAFWAKMTVPPLWGGGEGTNAAQSADPLRALVNGRCAPASAPMCMCVCCIMQGDPCAAVGW